MFDEVATLYDLSCTYIAGKYLYTADVLSRSPSPAESEAEELRNISGTVHFCSSITSILATHIYNCLKHSALRSLKTNPYNKL